MISVIIVNWNGKHHLKECLDSLRQQTYKDFEVVFVDNGSTDGSSNFVVSNYPEVRLIQLNYNSGFCEGNNTGIKHAEGDYLVLLNNDTRVEPDWLNNIHNTFSKYPEAGFCASKIVYYDQPDILDSAGDCFSICGAGIKRGHKIESKHYNKQEYVFGGCGAGIAFRKAVLDEIGLLDEDFFAIYEDVDISFRAQLAGYKCLFIPDAIIHHKVNSTLGKMSKFYVYNGQRNVEYTFFKNMPKKLLWKTLHIHILYNVLGFIFFLIKGRGWSFIKAKLDFLREFKKILEKRKQIQNNIKVSPDYIYSMFDKKWLTTRIRGKLNN